MCTLLGSKRTFGRHGLEMAAEQSKFVDPESEAATQARERPRRPFIEITRTKKIETQLTRIAAALEQILIEAYGYHTDIPTTNTSGPEPQVYYTDQDEHDIRDIVDDVKERQ